MTVPSKRRWFRFGLRTMFVVLTVLACSLGWLVWQMQIVRERKAVLVEIQRVCIPINGRNGFEYSGLESLEAVIGPNGVVSNLNMDDIRVSRFRRLLGDETCLVLGVGTVISPALIERMETAFPEADLSICDSSANPIATRDSLYKPVADRESNQGTIFKTGLIEK